MARIIGAITTSHVPAIGIAIGRHQQQDPYWKPFFDGYEGVQAWLAAQKPDAAIILYNDHGLNFFLDKMPTFAVGAAAEYHYADEGWGIPPLFQPFRGDQALSWHLIESLVDQQFDVTTCQEMQVDHAFAVPTKLLWPNAAQCPVATIPVAINTVQYPFPTPRRCFELGQAIGRAVASYPKDARVVVIGTGGLSHQLDGTRAGFINKPFDQWCMQQLVEAPQQIAQLSARDIVNQAGSQGVELIMWLAARGTLSGAVRRSDSHYHIPISNTAAAVMLMESANPQSAQVAH